MRQALNLATNKDAILKAVYQGQGQVAKNPIPPILWSYNNAVQDYPYDPAKAKQLLAQAGFPNGFDVELWYLPVTRPYNPDGKRMAEMIQADWEKVGVKAKLVTYEWAEYRKRAKGGEHQVVMFGWSGDNGDPDNFFVPLLGCEAVKGGGNDARWCNKPFEDLIIKAAQTPKQADRAKLYEQAQVIVKEEAPWITVAHSIRFEPVRKEVKGYKMDATAHHYFTTADIAKKIMRPAGGRRDAGRAISGAPHPNEHQGRGEPDQGQRRSRPGLSVQVRPACPRPVERYRCFASSFAAFS